MLETHCKVLRRRQNNVLRIGKLGVDGSKGRMGLCGSPSGTGALSLTSS